MLMRGDVKCFTLQSKAQTRRAWNNWAKSIQSQKHMDVSVLIYVPPKSCFFLLCIPGSINQSAAGLAFNQSVKKNIQKNLSSCGGRPSKLRSKCQPQYDDPDEWLDGSDE